MNTPRRLAALFALLVVLATAAFVIGVSVEKNQGHLEPGVEQTHPDEGSEASEGGEGEAGEGEAGEGEGEASEGGESEESETSSEGAEESEDSELVFGINTENTSLIVLGTAFSLALAGAVLRWPRREAFAIAAVFCLGFAALDGRELAHQLDENADNIAVLAGLTLALHLAAAGTAAVAVVSKRGKRPAEANV